MSKTLTFYVSGMTCTSCSGSVRRMVTNRLQSECILMEAFTVDLTAKDPKKITMVLSDTTEELEQLEQAATSQELEQLKKQVHRATWAKVKTYIEDAGFDCKEFDYAPENVARSYFFMADSSIDITREREEPTTPQPSLTMLERIAHQAKTYFASHWIKGIIGCSAGAAVLITCLTAASMSLAVMLPLGILSTLLTLALGANSYIDAWKKWQKSRTLTMDSLFAVSTSLIIVISLASLYVPWLPMMFDAALLIYGFRHVGLAIEDSIKERIGTAKFQDRAPKVVKKVTERGVEPTSLNQIKPGDVILIEPGEIIPLDGECVEENLIYNTIITGLILPQYFAPNAKVLAGMRLMEEAKPLSIRVSKSHKDSHLAQLDTQIEKAALEKSPIEIQTEQLLEYFIPSVILLAIATGTVVGIFFSPVLAIQSIASILVSACPCTLGLITPLAVKTGMHKAAENGVQFKSSKKLQEAEQIDTVIFDLNGTLTTGIPTVKQMQAQGISDVKLHQICAALEKNSLHPTGKAIYAYSQSHNSEELEVNELDRNHHSGIIGQISDYRYIIGSRSLMEKQKINVPADHELPSLDAGDDLVFIARQDINKGEKIIIGFIVMTDPLRDDAYHTISALKNIGKKVHLCTGAAKETAERYAKALGIEHVYAGCLSNEKRLYIQQLKNEGHKVAMIGDAGNDAEAMAESGFGIAVSSGDEVTQDTAAAVIHTGASMAIPSAFAISQQTVANIKQNLFISFGYNFAMIGVSGVLFTLGISINPAVGVILMMLQACMVLLNVHRFKEQPITHLAEQAHEYKQYSESSSLKMARRLSINENSHTYTQELPGNTSRQTREIASSSIHSNEEIELEIDEARLPSSPSYSYY